MLASACWLRSVWRRNSASSRARRLTSSQIVIQPPPGSGFSSRAMTRPLASRCSVRNGLPAAIYFMRLV
ncbi:hypothetical protein ACVWXO_002802 [Bradyrhizobium sp. LM2.7]